MSFEFSVTNLVIVAAVAFLAVFYVCVLLKLKPSTEKKDQYKKSVLPEKRELPPDNESIFVKSLETGEKSTLHQRTRNQINMQKIRPPFIKATSLSALQDRSQEPPEHVVISKAQSLNSRCAHHFGYLTELPKNTAIPTECLGCARAVECMTMLKVEEKVVKNHVAKS